MKPGLTREHRFPIIDGMLCLIMLLVILQLWLVTATMEAYLGGDDVVVWPAAAVSLVCFVLVGVLLRFLSRMEHIQ